MLTERARTSGTGLGEVDHLREVQRLGELFGMHTTDLLRYCDLKSYERTARAEPMRNYRYRWHAKASGGVRMIEAPKPTLRHLQRVVLRDIVGRLEPHEAAHGFRSGRSVHTCAAPHVGREVVIRMDLESFFTTVPVGRVFRIFTAAGIVDDAAHQLVGLVSNTVPRSVIDAAPQPGPARRPAHVRALRRLSSPHLPQGAPTSPGLANLATHGLDRRLSGLAAAFGGSYTRYADDLAFSGDSEMARRATALTKLAREIALDEGFLVNDSKTSVAMRGERQRVAGLVVNDRVNVERTGFDLLRAELHQAVREGPDVANRSGVSEYRAHLLGRISWFAQANPAKAERLSASFEQIQWPATGN